MHLSEVYLDLLPTVQCIASHRSKIVRRWSLYHRRTQFYPTARAASLYFGSSTSCLYPCLVLCLKLARKPSGEGDESLRGLSLFSLSMVEVSAGRI